MALQLPWAIQKVNGGDPDIEYPARLVRSATTQQQWTEGILGSTAFRVRQRAAGANFTVEVDAGTAIVTGDDEADQGAYVCQSTAVESVAINAAPGSNSRLDLVYLQVNDTQAGGPAGVNIEIKYLAGTPAASPVLPAVPASAIGLAQIGPITPSTPSITDSLITSLRVPSVLAHEVVDTSAIVPGAITTATIDDGAVTQAKLEAGLFAYSAWTPLLRGDGTAVDHTVDYARWARFGDIVIANFTITLDEVVINRHLSVRQLPVAAASTYALNGYGFAHHTTSGSTRTIIWKRRQGETSLTEVWGFVDGFALDEVSDNNKINGTIIYESTV